MENKDVSQLLVKLATETATLFGNNSKNLKFIYGFYLSNDEHPQVIGESLNIVSSTGLEKFATINLAYLFEEPTKNEVLIYRSRISSTLSPTLQSSLNRKRIPYCVRSENV